MPTSSQLRDSVSTMLPYITLSLILLAGFTHLFLYPILRYLLDRKGIREYPNYSWLPPLTDLRHCYLSSHGARSKDLVLEYVRRGELILRIGPNSVAFNHPDA